MDKIKKHKKKRHDEMVFDCVVEIIWNRIDTIIINVRFKDTGKIITITKNFATI